jgi:hypothetical protein
VQETRSCVANVFCQHAVTNSGEGHPSHPPQIPIHDFSNVIVVNVRFSEDRMQILGGVNLSFPTPSSSISNDCSDFESNPVQNSVSSAKFVVE